LPLPNQGVPVSGVGLEAGDINLSIPWGFSPNGNKMMDVYNTSKQAVKFSFNIRLTRRLQ